MKTISATEFKAHCLALLESVGPDGLVITKHGRPVAKLLPIGADSAELIGCLQGKIRIRGDILATGVKWNAES